MNRNPERRAFGTDRRIARRVGAHWNLAVTALCSASLIVTSAARAEGGQPGSAAVSDAPPNQGGQDAPHPDAAGADSAHPGSKRVAAAAQAFEHGQELDEQGDLRGALAEYQRAYELLPTFEVLYYIGSASLALRHWAQARRAFEQYLKLGGPDLSPEQSAAVRTALETLKTKTATLSLALNVPPSEVSIDSVPVAALEYPGMIVDPGEHLLRVEKPGFVMLEKKIVLGSGDRLQLLLQLSPVGTGDLRSQSDPAGRAITASPSPVDLSAKPAEPRAPWLPWTLTGTCAVGWATMAALELEARHDRNKVEVPGTPPSRIARDRRLQISLAVLSDVLLAGTLGFGAWSAYLTWWSSDRKAPSAPPPSAPSPQSSSGLWLMGMSGKF